MGKYIYQEILLSRNVNVQTPMVLVVPLSYLYGIGSLISGDGSGPVARQFRTLALRPSVHE